MRISYWSSDVCSSDLIDVQLVSTTRMSDLRRDQIDLAIRHGKGVWPGLDATFLLEESALPVCAPGYLELRDGEDPLAAFQRARLIVTGRFPDEWEEWARARGPGPSNLPGPVTKTGRAPGRGKEVQS